MPQQTLITYPLATSASGVNVGPVEVLSLVRPSSTYYYTTLATLMSSASNKLWQGQLVYDLNSTPTRGRYKLNYLTGAWRSVKVSDVVSSTTATPDNNTCEIDDIYIDRTNGIIHAKTAEAAWTQLKKWTVGGLTSGGGDIVLHGGAGKYLTITNGATTPTTKFYVNSENGDISSSGAFSLSGGATLSSTLTVSGLTTLNGGITADSGVFSVADVTGALHTSGDFDVATSRFKVLSASGNTTIDGVLTLNRGEIISDASTFNLYTGLTSSTTLNIGTGNTSTGNLKTVNIGTGGLSGSSTDITIGSGYNANGTTALYGKLLALNTETVTISGATTINDTLKIVGNAWSDQVSASSTAIEAWNVDLIDSNVHFKKVTAAGTFSVNIHYNDSLATTSSLNSIKGSTFIISVLNAAGAGNTVNVKFEDTNSVIYGGDISGKTIALANGEGLSFTGVVLYDGTTTKLYGIVSSISKNILPYT